MKQSFCSFYYVFHCAIFTDSQETSLLMVVSIATRNNCRGSIFIKESSKTRAVFIKETSGYFFSGNAQFFIAQTQELSLMTSECGFLLPGWANFTIDRATYKSWKRIKCRGKSDGLGPHFCGKSTFDAVLNCSRLLTYGNTDMTMFSRKKSTH